MKKNATLGAKRVLVFASLMSLTALLLAAVGSAAPAPETADTEGLTGSKYTPMGLRDGAMTVVLQLAGEPVAAVQGATGRKLTGAEKHAIKSRLQDTQKGLHSDIEAL